RSMSQLLATASSDVITLLNLKLPKAVHRLRRLICEICVICGYQLAQHKLIKLRSDRVDLDLPDHFFSKSVRQQAAPKLGSDAARLQVKQLFRIDLSDRRAVRTLHIVRINLQLG